MHNLVLSPIDTDTLIEKIAQKTAEIILQGQLISSTLEEDELLTRAATLKLLNITSATLWRWEKQNKIQSYGHGGKRYYKRSELMKNLTSKK